MKKLLLLLIGLFSFFGVSFGDTWTFPSNITYQATLNDSTSRGQSFMLSANMQLESITKYSQSNCPFWFIRTGNLIDTNSLLIYTGFISGNIVTFNNAYLTAGVLYTIESGSGNNYLSAGESCKHGYKYSLSDADKNNSRNTSGFFSRFNRVTLGKVQVFNSNAYWFDIVSFTFSGTYPPPPPTYTITSPLGIQEITQNITLTGNVNYDSGYPDFIVSSINNYNIKSDFFSDTFQNTQNSSGSNIYLSGYGYTKYLSGNDYVYTFPFCTGQATPIAHQFLTGFTVTGAVLTTDGNPFDNFMQNFLQLFISNIPSILIACAIFMVIFFIVRLVFPKKTIKPF